MNYEFIATQYTHSSYKQDNSLEDLPVAKHNYPGLGEKKFRWGTKKMSKKGLHLKSATNFFPEPVFSKKKKRIATIFPPNWGVLQNNKILTSKFATSFRQATNFHHSTSVSWARLRCGLVPPLIGPDNWQSTEITLNDNTLQLLIALPDNINSSKK